MPSHQVLAALALFAASLGCHAADGLVSVKSPRSAQETMDRLEGLVKERGLTVFARVNHSAGAATVGKTLRPTELLIFGNAQGGTPFIQCAQSVAIDLPLKALVWEDAAGQVWIGYNDLDYLAKRHGVPDCAAAAGLGKAITGIATAAIAR